IRILVDNVLLDCLGNSIDGDDNVWYGIEAERFSSTNTNITIRNCTITDWGSRAVSFTFADNNVLDNLNLDSNVDTGIYLLDSDNNNITNSDITNTGGEGIYLDSSDNNIISDSNVNNNNNGIYIYTSSTNTISTSYANDNNIGIYIYSSSNNTILNSSIADNNNKGIRIHSSQDNSIYDNIINNTDDTFFTGSFYYNAWNTSYQLSPSIINGTYMGGNYWAKPDGTGYSENCTDINADRICDNSYTINTSNIDYLPLAAADLVLPSGQ
ncbi:unnamed protein product, partial [marine sediment metagenome]